MQVLVAGGTGYVGSHSIAALSAAGQRVRVLARSPGEDRRHTRLPQRRRDRGGDRRRHRSGICRTWARRRPGVSEAASFRGGVGEEPVRVALRPDDMKLHAVEQGVLVDRAGVRSASTKGLKVGLSRRSEILVGDRRERQQLDLVDLDRHGTAPVGASHLDLWPRPEPVGDGNRSVCYSIAKVRAELHVVDCVGQRCRSHREPRRGASKRCRAPSASTRRIAAPHPVAPGPVRTATG
jgi:hypothetical protein